jgi:Icc-related predicted phosphoesterase
VITLLQVSDLHFGPHYSVRAGEAILRLAADLAPDVVVANGDFTQRAKPEQFRDARRFLDRLPGVPRVVVPGNHDVPLYRVVERLLAPYRNYREHISPELDQIVRVDGAVIVALNSTAPYTALRNGRIRRHQLEMCRRAFTEAPAGTARVVVAHHPLAPPPDYEGGDAVPGTGRALDFFESLGVELILGGHLHRTYVGSSIDVRPGGDPRRRSVIVVSGTSTSGRGRARERKLNSANLIRIDADALHVSHYMYFEDLEGFAPVARYAFPRGAQRFGHPTSDAVGAVPHAAASVTAPPPRTR